MVEPVFTAEQKLVELAASNVLNRIDASYIRLIAYNIADYVVAITACVEHPEWARWWYEEFPKMGYAIPSMLEEGAHTASNALIKALSIESELVGVDDE